MTNFQSYLEMGGYAGFVWPAYGVTVAALLLLAALSLRGARSRAAELKRLQAASPHRKRRAAAQQSPLSEVPDGL